LVANQSWVVVSSSNTWERTAGRRDRKATLLRLTNLPGRGMELPIVVAGAIILSLQRMFVLLGAAQFVGYCFQKGIQGLVDGVAHDAIDMTLPQPPSISINFKPSRRSSARVVMAVLSLVTQVKLSTQT